MLTTRRVLASLLAIVAVATSWTSSLDTLARENARSQLRNAFVAYASARALNGAISVAQGSELAISPAGVGVTLTLGEILDPVNDLVERFSWVVLVAAVSLGAQILLSELFSENWANVGISLVALVYVLGLWARPHWRWMHRVGVAALFVRFVLPSTMLLSNAIAGPIIADRQSESIDAIALANEALSEEPAPVAEETGAFGRLQRLFDQSRELLDVEEWLTTVRERAEEAIEHLVNLIILFAVQTVVLPVASLLFVYFATRQIWRRVCDL